MTMKVGLIGVRGMVGSVLLQRMLEENDFANINPVFFSGSQVGLTVPQLSSYRFHDAYDLHELGQMDVIISCQGSEYTEQIYMPLRQSGWQGYFIDAASHLRLDEDSIICLDPVNRNVIEQALKSGIKTFVGGNCTVSLMLMALCDLLRSGEVESVIASTYQAASGAGMQGIIALLNQMRELGNLSVPFLENSQPDFLNLDKALKAFFQHDYSDQAMGGLLAGNLLPWIDSDLGHGISREEAKALPEARKILGITEGFAIDSICVRVGAIRCHSQSIIIKMRRDWSLEEITARLQAANPWVNLVPNTKTDSLRALTPAAVSGTLDIAVGRVRKLDLPGHYWSLFTVGDQLLWGAAEPLRRMLHLIKAYQL